MISMKFVVAVEIPILPHRIVFVPIEFDNLTVPSMVVEISPSDFDSSSVPSWNVVEDLPPFANTRLLESSIHNDVSLRAVSD